jgi:hypothetical protein
LWQVAILSQTAYPGKHDENAHAGQGDEYCCRSFCSCKVTGFAVWDWSSEHEVRNRHRDRSCRRQGTYNDLGASENTAPFEPRNGLMQS